MSLPQWKGLFDWSMKYQDGTKPSQWDPDEYDPQKMKWLEGVLKHYMQDFAARMKQIKQTLDAGLAAQPDVEPSSGAMSAGQGGGQDNKASKAAAAQPAQPGGGAATGPQGAAGGTASTAGSALGSTASPAEMEALLEELMDIVSSIDYARDLHKIGGLPTLLELLDCRHPGLRWRAAEVVATCMANNPPVQQWFLDGGVFPSLLRLLKTEGSSEDEVMLRVKGILAISALVRHSAPAQALFLQHQGAQLLGRLTADGDARVKRKALSLLQYLVSLGYPAAEQAVTSGGVASAADVVRLHQGSTWEEQLGDGSTSDVRLTALLLLQEVAGASRDLWQAVKSTPGLQANLSALSSALASVPASEADMYADEASAAAQLAQLLAPDTPPASVPATPQAGKGQGDHVSVAADAAAKGSEPVTMAIREPPNSSSAAGEPAGSGSGAMPLGLPAP